MQSKEHVLADIGNEPRVSARRPLEVRYRAVGTQRGRLVRFEVGHVER